MMFSAWMTTPTLLVDDGQAWIELDGEGIFYIMLGCHGWVGISVSRWTIEAPALPRSDSRHTKRPPVASIPVQRSAGLVRGSEARHLDIAKGEALTVGIGQGLHPDDLTERRTERGEVVCGQVGRQRFETQHDPHDK
jgi:hypothetical protein